jgi:alkylation response protein AidB-like acyl-CoA dehydrogenase
MTGPREDDDTTEMEGVDAFRARARAWLAANLDRGSTPMARPRGETEEQELAHITHQRELQRRIYDGGFAGICFPREYGGLGLTPAHQQAWNEEIDGYEYPTGIIQVPTFAPCAAVLLEFGTEEQKQRHLPAILKGDEIWMQFLSEPSGGSDVAGALTTAVRDGDEWVINGSKIWTSGAFHSDYALCLLRTNWDVPKHRGLSVFIIKIRQPGIELHRIEMIDGSREFCQEFITDVRVPDSDRIGEIDQGWTVGTRWMFHERNAVGGGSPYVSGAWSAEGGAATEDPLFALARHTGQLSNLWVRDMLGEAHTLERARTELVRHLGEGMAAGVLPDTTAAIMRLMSGVVSVRRSTIAMEIAGESIAAAAPDDAASEVGLGYLVRQVACIGGGTTEMARNNIAERVLGMPREVTHDKNMPYRDVPKGPPTR